MCCMRRCSTRRTGERPPAGPGPELGGSWPLGGPDRGLPLRGGAGLGSADLEVLEARETERPLGRVGRELLGRTMGVRAVFMGLKLFRYDKEVKNLTLSYM